MPDFIFNNPGPMSQADIIQQLLQIASDANPEVKGSILSAVGRYAQIAQRPELQGIKVQADAAKQAASLEAKAAMQGSTLADKAAAREAALQMAINRGDLQKAIAEIKGLQDLSYLAQQQSGKLKELDLKGQQKLAERKTASDAAMDMATFKHMSKEEFLKLQDELKIKRQEVEYQFDLRKKQDAMAEAEAVYKQALGDVSRGPSSPRVQSAIKILEQTSPMRAADLQEKVQRVSNTVVNRVVRIGEQRLKPYGVSLDANDEAQIRAAWESGKPVMRVIDDKVAKLAADTAMNKEASALSKAADALFDKYSLPEQARDALRQKLGIVGQAEKATAATIEKEIVGSLAAGKRRRVIGGGVAGALVLGYLANKFAGGGDQKAQVDPQLQMLLLQQMAKSSGGDETKMQGQELMNMTRAVNLLQKMAQFQGMQSETPVNVARLM